MEAHRRTALQPGAMAAHRRHLPVRIPLESAQPLERIGEGGVHRHQARAVRVRYLATAGRPMDPHPAARVLPPTPGTHPLRARRRHLRVIQLRPTIGRIPIARRVLISREVRVALRDIPLSPPHRLVASRRMAQAGRVFTETRSLVDARRNASVPQACRTEAFSFLVVAPQSVGCPLWESVCPNVGG